MSISKNKTMFAAVIFIAMAIFNVIVFVMPVQKNGAFWTGYSFTMAAFILTAGVILYAFDRETLKSKFYRVPLLFVVKRYLYLQILLGLIQIASPTFLTITPFQYYIVINAILLGFCLIGLFTVDVAVDEVERIDEKIKPKVVYIKLLQTQIENIALRTTDDTKKILKDLAEKIKYSDPMSSDQLATIEREIMNKVACIEEAVTNNDIETIRTQCEQTQILIAERNAKCKVLK